MTAQEKIEKPLPVVDPGSAFYWKSAREHRLMLPRCLDCGKQHFYPRDLCPHCYSDKLEWMQASGNGVIYSYTIARRGAGPGFAADAPYVVAVIELDEGPRMLSNVRTQDVEAVRIGMKVKTTFDDRTDDIALPMFVLS